MYKLNLRGTITQWTTVNNAIGTPEKVLVDSWDKWMQVDDRSGSLQTPVQQDVWTYDYKIIMRYEKTRPTKSNMTIDYENGRLIIRSVQIKTEGAKTWEICRCSKVDIEITQS